MKGHRKGTSTLTRSVTRTITPLLNEGHNEGRSIMDIYRDVVELTGARPSKNLLDRTPEEWDSMWGQVGR